MNSIQLTNPNELIELLNQKGLERPDLEPLLGALAGAPLEDAVLTKDEFVAVVAQNPALSAANGQNIFRHLVSRFGSDIDSTEGSSLVDALSYPPAHMRPSWISDAEAFWLEVDGLAPVASYKGNTVTIKLKKPGLTADDILSTLNPYKAWEQTSMVENSFLGELNGQQYLFTGTRYLQFTPTITTFDVTQSNGRLHLAWAKADPEIAKQFLEANRDTLTKSLQEAGLSKGVDDYIQEIMNNYGSVVAVNGRHEYDFAEGYYRYEQTVQLGWMAQAVVNGVGASAIKNAALKIAYMTLGEKTLAGDPGENGKTVLSMSGKEMQASQ